MNGNRTPLRTHPSRTSPNAIEYSPGVFQAPPLPCPAHELLRLSGCRDSNNPDQSTLAFGGRRVPPASVLGHRGRKPGCTCELYRAPSLLSPCLLLSDNCTLASGNGGSGTRRLAPVKGWFPARGLDAARMPHSCTWKRRNNSPKPAGDTTTRRG